MTDGNKLVEYLRQSLNEINKYIELYEVSEPDESLEIHETLRDVQDHAHDMISVSQYLEEYAKRTDQAELLSVIRQLHIRSFKLHELLEILSSYVRLNSWEERFTKQDQMGLSTRTVGRSLNPQLTATKLLTWLSELGLVVHEGAETFSLSDKGKNFASEATLSLKKPKRLRWNPEIINYLRTLQGAKPIDQIADDGEAAMIDMA